MGLRIVYGRAGTGKSYYCIKEIIKCLKEDTLNKDALNEDAYKGRKLIFLVPEQFTVQAEKMLLAEPDCGNSIIRADVVSFKRMAHRVTGETGLLGTKVIDVPGRRMILYKAIEECKGSLKLFKGALEHFGLVNEILQLIEEIGRYNFTKEKMDEVVNELPDELPVKQKLTELSAIYGRYEEILHRNYVDDKDLMDILSEKIREYPIYEGAKVWIDGFFGFTPQEYSIIRELALKAEEVTVTLCCDDPGNRRFEASDFLHSVYGTYDKLTRMTQENNIKIEKSVELKNKKTNKSNNDSSNIRHKDNKALAHFEREYESYPVKIFRGDVPGMGIYIARDIYSEVEFAACEIRCLCRDKGFHYRDVAVIAKNIESYVPVCRDVFIRNDIPFFVDSKKDLTRHPLARLIISALDTVINNFSYRTMFTYLKTGLLNYDQETVDMIENHVLARNITSYRRWTSDEWWVFDDEELHNNINGERRKILEPLIKLKDKFGRNKTIREYAEALFAFLTEIRISDIIVNRQEAGLHEKAFGEYIKIWNGFIGILDKLVESLGENHVTPAKFLDILKAGLEDYQTGEIPSTLDGIQIGNLERTKNSRIKALFFLGVNEGVVPGGAAKEGLLTDRDRQMLKDHSVTLAADSREQIYLEEFQIYSALMAPSEYLYVSYIIKDPAGKAQRPSRIVNRMTKMFPGIEIRDDILKEEMYLRPLDTMSSGEHAFSKYLSYLGTDGRNEVWEEAGRYFSNHEKYRDRIEKAKEYRNTRSRDVRISEDRAAELFGENITTSISLVEKYNSCPYSFYAEYGIKAREREIMEFSKKDAGIFVHGILEKIGGAMTEADIDEIVKNVLKEGRMFSMKDSKRSEFFAKRMVTMVKRVVNIISNQIKMGQFTPYEFEAECNIRIPLANGREARLRGKIDRIDVYRDEKYSYYRVIDYKTGNKGFDFSEVYCGTDIQLPAYLYSVTKNVSNAVPAGGFYFSVRDSFLKLDASAGRSEIESACRKKFRLNGFMLADTDVAAAMDKNIGSTSEIIPAGIKKDGTFSSNSWVATDSQFGRLFSHVEDVVSDAIEGYTKGKVAPAPLKKARGGYSPCEYCRYQSLCGFDTDAGDKYRIMKNIDKKQIWEMLKDDN